MLWRFFCNVIFFKISIAPRLLVLKQLIMIFAVFYLGHLATPVRCWEHREKMGSSHYNYPKSQIIIIKNSPSEGV
jgi:hypothetical protein